uniref:C-type lectin domain-containing protein n=1 Tax=Scophthalmus maximus TaxID=52904 RepID=A0A8D3AYI2_SCOMX
MSWPNAQSYCRSNYTDLATVDNRGDMERLKDMAVASGVKTETWIGLTRADSASWLWSLGETGMSHESANFTNWDPLTDPSHECGGMTAEGRWLGAPCATTLPFVCQEDEASGALHVILQNKTWKLAREYCQLNNMDLASARSWDENDAVEAVIYESRSSLSLFWIGLVKDMWEWSDQSNSSFRAWSTSQPNNDGQCTLYKPSDNTWFDRGCANNYPFYCYIGKHIFYSLILPCTTYTFLHYPESAILNTMNKTEGILDVMFYFHWFDCRQKERELQAGCEGGNDIKFTL